MKQRRRTAIILGWILMVSLVFGCSKTEVYASDKEMTIYGIYLGEGNKGDSVLLESKGEYLLMDIGQETATPYVVAQLQNLGVTHLSLYFSHLHMDHVGGKDAYNILGGMEMIRNAGIQIDRLYLPAEKLSQRSIKNPVKYAIIREYANGKFPIFYLDVGDVFPVGDAVGKVIGPINEPLLTVSQYQTESYTVYENNCSLVTIFTCGNTKYLTTGDCQAEEAEFLLQRYGAELDCDIMKLSHHGTGTGNTRALIEAVSPSYSFALNGAIEGKNPSTGKWRTYAALTRASDSGICYMVGNEKETVIYHVKNDVIEMYRGESIQKGTRLHGWVELTGGDGLYRSTAMYYINSQNEILTGIQNVCNYYYNFGSGGRMEYGKYTESGYSPWKKDANGTRCYLFTDNGKYARMQMGFSKVFSKLYYFDEDGYRVEPESVETFTRIDGRKYVMNGSGAIYVNQLIDVYGNTYYLNARGNIVTSTKEKIDGEYYIFDEYGMLVYSEEECILYEYKGKYYGIYETGAVITEDVAEIDGYKYYFDKDGICVTQRKVKIGKSYYYFGKSGRMVMNKRVKIGKNSYYFGENGKMYRKKYVRLSNGKKYYCDKNGVMKVVTEKNKK